MHCEKCAAPLAETDAFCSQCGHPTPSAPPPAPPTPPYGTAQGPTTPPEPTAPPVGAAPGPQAPPPVYAWQAPPAAPPGQPAAYPPAPPPFVGAGAATTPAAKRAPASPLLPQQRTLAGILMIAAALMHGAYTAYHLPGILQGLFYNLSNLVDFSYFDLYFANLLFILTNLTGLLIFLSAIFLLVGGILLLAGRGGAKLPLLGFVLTLATTVADFIALNLLFFGVYLDYSYIDIYPSFIFGQRWWVWLLHLAAIAATIVAWRVARPKKQAAPLGAPGAPPPAAPYPPVYPPPPPPNP